MKYSYLCLSMASGLGLLMIGGGPAAAQQSAAQQNGSRDMILRLDALPDALLKIGVPPGATIYRWPPEYGDVPWAGATVYVRKDFTVPRMTGCARDNLVDEIDLTAIRRNGFHLVEARLGSVFPSQGFKVEYSQISSPSATLVNGNGEPTETVRDAEKIRLSGVVLQRDRGNGASAECIDIYRLNIVLRGPGGKNPMDGLAAGLP